MRKDHISRSQNKLRILPTQRWKKTSTLFLILNIEILAVLPRLILAPGLTYFSVKTSKVRLLIFSSPFQLREAPKLQFLLRELLTPILPLLVLVLVDSRQTKKLLLSPRMTML